MNISLVIPCYNEESNLQKGVLDKIGNYTHSDGQFSEILIVDDGSTDRSKQIIKEKYLNAFPKFRLIENVHMGKAFSLITGIRAARGEYVMFTDIDLATPIEEAEKLIRAAGRGYDITIGSRSAHREGAPYIRRIMAQVFIWIREFVIGLHGIKDTQCGFKLFKTEAAKRIIDKLVIFHTKRPVSGSSVSAGFDLEFLFLASKLRYKIREIPVTWRHVETKNVHFIHDSIETLNDIFLMKLYDMTGKYQ